MEEDDLEVDKLDHGNLNFDTLLGQHSGTPEFTSTQQQSTSRQPHLDSLLMLSDASAALPPMPAFPHDAMTGLETSASWTGSVFDDILLELPLFQAGGEATAFLNSLKQNDYYNAAPSTFASPVATVVPSLNEDESEGFEAPPIIRIRHGEQIFEEVRRLSPVCPDDDYAGVSMANLPATHALDEKTFDDLRAELAKRDTYEAVTEPSSSFLATSLQYYWRQVHIALFLALRGAGCIRLYRFTRFSLFCIVPPFALATIILSFSWQCALAGRLQWCARFSGLYRIPGHADARTGDGAVERVRICRIPPTTLDHRKTMGSCLRRTASSRPPPRHPAHVSIWPLSWSAGVVVGHCRSTRLLSGVCEAAETFQSRRRLSTLPPK